MFQRFRASAYAVRNWPTQPGTGNVQHLGAWGEDKEILYMAYTREPAVSFWLIRVVRRASSYNHSVEFSTGALKVVDGKPIPRNSPAPWLEEAIRRFMELGIE